MINPFDRTFFKLMLGFVLILSFSFMVLFLVDKYSTSLSGQEYASVKSTSLNK